MKKNCFRGLMMLSFSLFSGLTFGFAMDGVLATATLKPTEQGSTIAGTATFEEMAEGLEVHVEVTGAPPGLHGIHIHRNGSCNNHGDAAGGHLNPDSVEHGNLGKDGFAKAHAGDLGNIQINADGTGILETTLPGLTVTGDRYSVTGRSLVIHETEDDFGQPTGNAGERIACGVI